MVSLGRRWDGDTRGTGIDRDGCWIADDVAVGMLPTDTPFHPHGHLLKLQIGGPDVATLCVGTPVAPRGIT